MKRLKSILVILAAVLLTAPVVQAETVSRRDAQRVAELFFNAARGIRMAPPNYTFSGRNFTTNGLFIPFYVFSHPTGGFVIVSAENKAYPILAYSLKGKLEAGRLSAGQKALLNQYGRHIEFIRYDSQAPEEAVKAWCDIQHHIASLLQPQLDVTDLLLPWDEVTAEVGRLYDRADARDLQSAYYTPAQWDAMVGDELRTARNVVMAIVNPQGGLEPAVATGRRGDFFRLRFNDQPGDAMYRLFATELISQGEMAVISNPIGAPEELATEELPFTFYDSFIEETGREQESRRAAIDEILAPTGPVVTWQGSGQFSVYLPESAEQAIVYNVAGMRVAESRYHGTDMAQIDLSVLPPGFYIALLRGESGRTYSLRLYR